jgi:hypothetical protein
MRGTSANPNRATKNIHPATKMGQSRITHGRRGRGGQLSLDAGHQRHREGAGFRVKNRENPLGDGKARALPEYAPLDEPAHSLPRRDRQRLRR